MTRRSLWLLGVGIALVLLITGYILSQMEWEKVSEVTGLREEAQKDPVFALNRLLENYQSSIERREDFDSVFDPLTRQIIAVPGETGLVIDEALLKEDQQAMQSLYRWAESGGHLVYVVSSSRTDETTNWLFDKLAEGIERVETAEKPIYDITGFADDINAWSSSITASDREQDETEVIEPDAYDLELYMPYRFVLGRCKDAVWVVVNTEARNLACRQRTGRGSVTLLTDTGFYNGFGLRVAENARMAIGIFSGNRSNLYFEGDNQRNWLTLLLGQNWQVYALLALLLGFTFWNLYVRFGPSLVPVKQGYSQFGQHLENLGRFYRQTGHEHLLKQVLLAELDRIMEQRVAGFAAADRSSKVAILVRETSATEVFADNLLNENINDDALWLAQVQFVKELKV